MKYSCEMVQDLLPLYHDKACSGASRKVVEEHLSECGACRSLLQKYEHSVYDNLLQKESADMIGRYNRKVQRKSLYIGAGIAGVLLIPILVCLIVNIATGHALDWFFIVLTALMVLASVTVVPLVVSEQRMLWTLGSFTGSLLLLLLSSCLYGGGDWFLIAASGVLFGLSVFFMPLVVYRLPLSGFWCRQKGLLALSADTVLLYNLIFVCGWYSGSDRYWMPAFGITTVCMLYVWIFFAVVRYLRANGFIRTGICMLLTGVFGSTVSDLIRWIQDGCFYLSMRDANILSWQTDTLINANSYLLIFLAGVCGGLMFILAGLLKNRLQKK